MVCKVHGYLPKIEQREKLQYLVNLYKNIEFKEHKASSYSPNPTYNVYMYVFLFWKKLLTFFRTDDPKKVSDEILKYEKFIESTNYI